MKKDNQEYLIDKTSKEKKVMKKENVNELKPLPQNYTKRGFFSKDFWNDRNVGLLTELKTGKEEYKDLDVRLRGNEIHVYYNGGKILGIKKNAIEFDDKYLRHKESHPNINIENIKNKWFYVNNNGNLKIKPVSNLTDFPSFINDLKSVMDAWFKENPHDERMHQQFISLKEHDNLYIIDIEFAVSFNSKCYNKEYKDTKKRLKEKENYKPFERYPNPRFDLIGIDNSGQIHVFELKTGLNSTKNMTEHIEDFVNMIGSADTNFQVIRFEEFNNEMALILDTYNSNNTLKNKIPVKIDIKKRPIFHFIFTEKGDESNFDEFSKLVKDIYKKLDIIPEYHQLIEKHILDTEAIKVSKDFKIKI
ncbi:MAG: hypothetical protein J1F16_01190 [Muribaculaceae bacterium]|nr:hypothetical protein [Muribaculaceae bacterium]